MNISTLPDLCYLLIFDRLSTQNMSTISLVCHRWNELKIKACKQRHHLHIMIFPRSETKENSFKDQLLIPIEKIEQSIRLKIINTFSNVHKLTIHFTSLYLKKTQLLFIVDLLNTKKWSSNLVLFGLKFSCVWPDSDSPYPDLIESINKLLSLKHLELCWNFPSNHIHLLTILPKLQSFVFHSWKNENFYELIRLLKLEFGRNTRLSTLESIQIGMEHSFKEGISYNDALLSLDAGLAQKITYFNYFGYLTDPEFKRCIEHFPMMKKLNFFIFDNFRDESLPFTERFNHLAANQNLRELVLSLHTSKSLVKLNLDVKFAPLPSVTKLSIWIDDNTPKKITSQLADSFPNLTYLKIDSRHSSVCNVCDINSEMYLANHDQQRACIRHLAEPFQVACTKLRKIIIIFIIHEMLKKCMRNLSPIRCVLKPPFEIMNLIEWNWENFVRLNDQ